MTIFIVLSLCHISVVCLVSYCHIIVLKYVCLLNLSKKFCIYIGLILLNVLRPLFCALTLG